MTPQEQPDSQAGDELPTSITMYIDPGFKYQAIEAITDYAERLAAKRAIDVLERLESKADTYALRQTIADEGKDGIKVVAAVPLSAIEAERQQLGKETV